MIVQLKLGFLSYGSLRSKIGIGTVSENADVLLEFFDLGREDSNLSFLRLGFFHQTLKLLIEHFILISLSLYIQFYFFVVSSDVLMDLILNNLSLLNQDIHHDINLLPDLVSLFLEHLQQIVASY